MSFDPYYHWLGIPPREQPPNHYRLLGIELFEPNEDVISFAADRQMAHLRAFQNSKQAADSQRLLNEVSAARVCLLSSERRAAYDAELRERLAERSSAAQSHPSHLTPPDHAPPHHRGPVVPPEIAVAPPPILAVPSAEMSAVAMQNVEVPATQDPGPETPFYSSLASPAPTVYAETPQSDRAPSVETVATTASHGVSTTPANRPIPLSAPQSSSSAPAAQPFVVTSSSRTARRRPKNAGVELFKIVAGGAFGCVIALALLWFGFGVDPVGWHDHVDPKMLEDVGRRLGKQQSASGGGNSSADRRNSGRGGPSGARGSGFGDGGGPGRGTGGGDHASGDGAAGEGGDPSASASNSRDNPGVDKTGRASSESGGLSKLPTARGRNRSPDGSGDSVGGSSGTAPNDSASRNGGGPIAGNGAGPGILARGTVPMPTKEDRTAALKLLDESYKVASAKTAAEKKACAEKLLAASKESSVSSAERFALWQRTASLAAEAGEAKLVQIAIEDMARTYDYDAGNAMETMLVRALENVKDEATLDACIPVTQKTIFEFIARDEVDAAMRLTDATYTTCLKAFGKKHRKFVFDGQALMRRLEQHWLRAREARDAIASGAGTPTHQRELGRYLCVFNGQWDQGLPHLVQGDNETYAAAARQDLEKPADSAARIAVADRWYDIALANPSDEGFAARAIHWYSQSVGDATGLAKTKAMTRLEELRRLLDELDKRELCAARILRSQFR